MSFTITWCVKGPSVIDCYPYQSPLYTHSHQVVLMVDDTHIVSRKGTGCTAMNRFPDNKLTSVVPCLHLSVPAKMFRGAAVPPMVSLCGHWSMSTRRRSTSIPDVPLQAEKYFE